MINKVFLLLLINSAHAHGGEQIILSFLIQISLMFIFLFWIAASSKTFTEKIKPILIILAGIPLLNILLFIPDFLGLKISLDVFLWIMPISLILGYISLRVLYKKPLLKAIKNNLLSMKQL
jgi:hypothetical protein